MLRTGDGGKRVTIFRDQRESSNPFGPSLRSDNGGHMHANAGVDEAHQDVSGDWDQSRSWYSREKRRRSISPVKSNAVDKVVKRRVVDRRRVAGVVSRRSGIAAPAGLAGPHCSLAEIGGIDPTGDRRVLYRGDFAAHPPDLRTVGVTEISRASGTKAHR